MLLRLRSILSVAILVAVHSLAMAQQPPTLTSDPASALLPVNYRITLVNQDGHKPVGELSSLTCSPKVSVDGVIETKDDVVPENKIPITCVVRGNFQDENGIIIFAYEITARLPVPSQVLTNDRGRVVTSLTYRDVRCSGTLRMKAGKTYPVFQTGGRTFSLSITPEGDH